MIVSVQRETPTGVSFVPNLHGSDTESALQALQYSRIGGAVLLHRLLQRCSFAREEPVLTLPRRALQESPAL